MRVGQAFPIALAHVAFGRISRRGATELEADPREVS
jgi:hypothetical protein